MPYLETAKRSKDKTIGKYKPKIKKFFTAQTGRILERFNEYLNLPKLSGDDLLNPSMIDPLIDYLMPDVENQLLAETMKPMHTSGTQKGIEDINKLSGASVSSALTNSQVNLGLQRLASQITEINITTKSILRDVIEQGIEDGRTIFQIANDIEDVGVKEGWYKGRELAIARTETRRAYDLGGRIAYKELGVEKFDVVGCVGTLAGTNEWGFSASYGDFSESIGSCGVLEMPMNLWDAVSGVHHVSHAGIHVSSYIPIQ